MPLNRGPAACSSPRCAVMPSAGKHATHYVGHFFSFLGP